MKFKRILVPHDFSIESDCAMEAAFMVAKNQECVIDLLNIFQVPTPKKKLSDIDNIAYLKEVGEQNWRRLNRYVAQEKFSGVKICMNQVEYPINETVPEVIGNFSRKTQSDIVIMGTKGASGMVEVVNGSTTADTMREVKVPLLTVQGFVAIDKIEQLVYTSEYDDKDEKYFEKVNVLAKMFGAKVHFLIIHPEEEDGSFNEREAIHRMKLLASKYELEDFTLNIRHSSFLQSGVAQFCEEVNADMVVVGYHDGRTLKHKYQGSIAEDFIHSQSRPVLTVKY